MMDIFKTVPSACDELAQAMSKAVGFVRAYRRARSERVELLTMSERELHDVGLSRIDAVREAQKPLWRSYPPLEGREQRRSC